MKRTLQGKVISDKSDNTIVVEIKRLVTHPLYHKKYIISKKYKVHVEKNKPKIGDNVAIIECRPISKDKKWEIKNDSKTNKTKRS